MNKWKKMVGGGGKYLTLINPAVKRNITPKGVTLCL